MAYEGTHTQASIKERAAKLQEEAAVLQAKIVQHLQHNHGQSIVPPLSMRKTTN